MIRIQMTDGGEISFEGKGLRVSFDRECVFIFRMIENPQFEFAASGDEPRWVKEILYIQRGGWLRAFDSAVAGAVTAAKLRRGIER